MISRSLSLVDIVHGQQASTWYILFQPVGFIIFLVAAVAETNRAPFDLPEAESELVAGYHTEYAGMKFAMFQMGEYVSMIVISALGATLFLGGYAGPWLPSSLGFIWLMIKIIAAAVPVHLAARDAAAAAVRPADALRLEGPAAGRHRQPRGHGDHRRRVLPDVMPMTVSPGGRRMSVQDQIKGFGITFRTMLSRPLTLGYPEVKTPVFPRFRGRHQLWRYDNGLEKCVGCSLCVAACPADCIRVVAEENTPEHRVSAGERYARIYEINMSRCIFCGYCELACPFDAITLEHSYELSERDARPDGLHEGHAVDPRTEATAAAHRRPADLGGIAV